MLCCWTLACQLFHFVCFVVNDTQPSLALETQEDAASVMCGLIACHAYRVHDSKMHEAYLKHARMLHCMPCVETNAAGFCTVCCKCRFTAEQCAQTWRGAFLFQGRSNVRKQTCTGEGGSKHACTHALGSCSVRMQSWCRPHAPMLSTCWELRASFAKRAVDGLASDTDLTRLRIPACVHGMKRFCLLPNTSWTFKDLHPGVCASPKVALGSEYFCVASLGCSKCWRLSLTT